jgi:hypothetical protein
MFQFPEFASYPYVFESKIPYHNAWKPVLSCPHGPKACGRRGPKGPTGSALRRKPLARSKPTKQISQAFKVGCPIRRSMDQSSFAAPHGFSQRITSFFACACQGIHQMPLRHLIVLIANAHQYSHPSGNPRRNDQMRGGPVTFYNQPFS